MAQTFSVGPVTLTGWEVGEKVKFPRRTLASYHDIPQTDDSAAERIAQTFGVFADTITFEGTCLGATADDDIRNLEALQDAQAVVPFICGPRVFDVIIDHIEPEYVSIGEINFTITLEPLLERRASATSPAQDASGALEGNLDQIEALAAQVPAVAPANLDPSVLSNINIVSAQRSSIGTISLATVQQQISFGQSLFNALSSVQNSLNTLRQTSGTSNIVQMLESLNGTLGSAYRTLGTYTGAAANTPTVRVSNTTVYAVSANYTGDWTNYPAIMAANDLTDPFINGSMNLVIPRV